MDVGTGSGYLTLAMSKMMNDQGSFIGIKHMKDLIDFGIKNISKHNKGLLDDKKIKLILEDERLGCKTEGPFDCIHAGGVAVNLLQNYSFSTKLREDWLFLYIKMMKNLFILLINQRMN